MKTPSITHRTGLDDIEFRLVRDRGMRERLLYVDFHIDEDWVMYDGAPNNWIGTVSDDGGDEVKEFYPANHGTFNRRFKTACKYVTDRNARVLRDAEAA